MVLFESHSARSPGSQEGRWGAFFSPPLVLLLLPCALLSPLLPYTDGGKLSESFLRSPSPSPSSLLRVLIRPHYECKGERGMAILTHAPAGDIYGTVRDSPIYKRRTFLLIYFQTFYEYFIQNICTFFVESAWQSFPSPPFLSSSFLLEIRKWFQVI